MEKKPTAPALAELLAGYLERQAAAAGLHMADRQGDVVPFEAVPVQPVDPRLAWSEAVAAVHFLCPPIEARSWQPPPDWPGLVAGHEPVLALAFCTGNFPQLVRSFQPLLHITDWARVRPSAGRALSAPMLEDWAAQAAQRKEYARGLIAIGGLRLANHLDSAAQLLAALQAAAPVEWQPALANEQAALAWHCGRAKEAAALWRAQPQTAPVLFNRGMAALFLGKPKAARSCLRRAIEQIPETSGWHHLGRLYLALAEM